MVVNDMPTLADKWILVFDQSSPVHPVSESRERVARAWQRRRRRSTEIIVSNIGLTKFCAWLLLVNAFSGWPAAKPKLSNKATK